jgi:hypothetical protein
MWVVVKYRRALKRSCLSLWWIGVGVESNVAIGSPGPEELVEWQGGVSRVSYEVGGDECKSRVSKRFGYKPSVGFEECSEVARAVAQPGRHARARHTKRSKLRNIATSSLDLPPLTAGCGVDLRELWRFCVNWCATICHCPCNNLTHANTPRTTSLLFCVPGFG